MSLDAILSLAPPVAISVLFPILYLSIIRWLDLYASGSFKTVLACLGWGIASTIFVLNVNNFFVRLIGLTNVEQYSAPIAEEILKSLILLYLVRRPSFTYFVDGAVFGFAAGTGFTIVENLLYLSKAGAAASLPVALTRAFTTSLLHGSATAMTGVALGRLKFGRGIGRAVAPILGWGSAIGLHMAFNRVVTGEVSLLTLALVLGIALLGIGLVITFVLVGLREERRWILEELKMDLGVSAGESKVVQEMANFDTLLAPISQRFGNEKRKQVEEFLHLQAQLGIKRKAQEKTHDPVEKAELGTEVVALQEEMDTLRRDVGIYCMTYVRSILPPETEPMWIRLNQTIAKQKSADDKSLWNSLEGKLEQGQVN